MIGATRPVTEPASPDFEPVRMDLIDLDSELAPIPAQDAETGIRYGSSLTLVRLHDRPLGLLELDLPPGGLSAVELADRIALRLGDRVAEHLRRDGLSPSRVTADGIAVGTEVPPCLAAREQLLRDPPTASVVIITRGRPERVRRTVGSILAGSYPHERYEVIVVDTPSDDAPLLDFSDDQELAGSTPIRVVEELRPGISRGRNTGLAEAGGEFVVFADDDVDVDHNWLATSINAFGYADNVGATSGMTLPGALLTPAQRWFEGFGGLQRRFDSRVYDLHRPPADEPLFPFTVGALGSGRSMAFRRRLLRQLGGFDLALGPDNTARAGEDIEALARVLLSGRQVVHEPAAIVWHEHPSTYAALAATDVGLRRRPHRVPDEMPPRQPGVAPAARRQAPSRPRVRALAAVGEEPQAPA